MKVAIFTKRWPLRTARTSKITAAFRELALADTYDIRVITTSRNGYGSIEGRDNIVINRVESTPDNVTGLYESESLIALARRRVDVAFSVDGSAPFNFIPSIPVINFWDDISLQNEANIPHKFLANYTHHVVTSDENRNILQKYGITLSKITLVDSAITSNVIEKILLSQVV